MQKTGTSQISELLSLQQQPTSYTPLRAGVPPTPKGTNRTRVLPHMCPPSQEAQELATPICSRTQSTTSMRTKEP